MSGKQVSLSKRLQMLASMVTPGNRIVDVGCDHGFLPIRLVQSGKVPGALAMDVRKGPLEAAREHIADWGLEEYINVRLSDGLKEYRKGEAETLVCAGMGGRLMERILTESIDKAESFQELILQPQSELCEFRACLRKFGFAVVKEDAVCEDGKFYFAMKATYGGKGSFEDSNISREAENPEEELPGKENPERLYDMYGELLLKDKHPVLKQYLIYRNKIVKELLNTLGCLDSERADVRIRETEGELALIEKALTYYFQ